MAYNVSQSLRQSVEETDYLPEVPALQDLYDLNVRPRAGQLIMVVGRSGSQKSGFTLWWTISMGLPTLYFSADMSKFDAAVRVAECVTGLTGPEVEAALGDPASIAREDVLTAVADVNVVFSFGTPIGWRRVAEEIDAFVEMWNEFPAVIVFDNLMDIAGAESEYAAQMAAMQDLAALARETGSTVIVMHHATDKSWDARTDPWAPPSRDQVKGGMSEKTELTLSVGLDPHNGLFRIAPIKCRSGFQDATARTYAVLKVDPARTTFERYQHDSHIKV